MFIGPGRHAEVVMPPPEEPIDEEFEEMDDQLWEDFSEILESHWEN